MVCKGIQQFSYLYFKDIDCGYSLELPSIDYQLIHCLICLLLFFMFFVCLFFVITQNDRFICTIFIHGLFLQFPFLLIYVILIISSLLIKLIFPLCPSFYSLLFPSFLSFSLSFLIPSLLPSLCSSYFKDSQMCTRIICILVNVDMTPDLTLSALMAQISIVHMEC